MVRIAASTCVESVRCLPRALIHPRSRKCASRRSNRRRSAPLASRRLRNSESTELGRPLARYRELPCSIGPPPNCTCPFPSIQLSSRSIRYFWSCSPSSMDSQVTKVANHKSLSSAGCHDFDPTWSFSTPLFEISELADMMHFHVFP